MLWQSNSRLQAPIRHPPAHRVTVQIVQEEASAGFWTGALTGSSLQAGASDASKALS